MRITRILTSAIGTAMLAGTLMLAPQAAQGQVFVSVGFAPPAIPIYEQPYCPGEGYIWTPGYWAYTDDGYEWVDGAWVIAPYTGALWTPGYWGYGGDGYFWNAGYWGPSVGYYGGINYGFGYFGTGFYGGYWNGGSFFYNREYNRFDRDHDHDFHHVYDRHVDGVDGRPGGSSFARRSEGWDHGDRGGTFNGNTTRSFNGATDHSAFGHNGSNDTVRPTNQPYRGNFNGNGATGNFTGNRGAYQPPAQSLARPEGNFRGSSTNFSYSRPAAPANNFHPGQGGSFNGGPNNFSNARPAAPANAYRPSFNGNSGGGFGSASNARSAAPMNNFHPSQGGNFGGGVQRSAPAPSFQGGGGQRSAPAPSFQGGGGQRSAPAPSFQGGGGFHGGGGRGVSHGGGGGNR